MHLRFSGQVALARQKRRERERESKRGKNNPSQMIHLVVHKPSTIDCERMAEEAKRAQRTIKDTEREERGEREEITVVSGRVTRAVRLLSHPLAHTEE